jgi:hypothetical protein
MIFKYDIADGAVRSNDPYPFLCVLAKIDTIAPSLKVGIVSAGYVQNLPLFGTAWCFNKTIDGNRATQSGKDEDGKTAGGKKSTFIQVSLVGILPSGFYKLLLRATMRCINTSSTQELCNPRRRGRSTSSRPAGGRWSFITI